MRLKLAFVVLGFRCRDLRELRPARRKRCAGCERASHRPGGFRRLDEGQAGAAAQAHHGRSAGALCDAARGERPLGGARAARRKAESSAGLFRRALRHRAFRPAPHATRTERRYFRRRKLCRARPCHPRSRRCREAGEGGGLRAAASTNLSASPSIRRAPIRNGSMWPRRMAWCASPMQAAIFRRAASRKPWSSACRPGDISRATCFSPPTAGKCMSRSVRARMTRTAWVGSRRRRLHRRPCARRRLGPGRKSRRRARLRPGRPFGPYLRDGIAQLRRPRLAPANQGSVVLDK